MQYIDRGVYSLTRTADPLFRVRQSAKFRQDAATANALSPALPSSAVMSPEGSLSQSRITEKADAKLVKFENCLLQEDVDMGMPHLFSYHWFLTFIA